MSEQNAPDDLPRAQVEEMLQQCDPAFDDWDVLWESRASLCRSWLALKDENKALRAAASVAKRGKSHGRPYEPARIR